MKNLPIGISDFKTLIENNYYYIDKTPFIEEVAKNVGQTFLFIRPRRFGKTLNMSMLKYFFDVEMKEENRKLFQGLYIENSPAIKEQGKYPVIFISMKEIKGSSFEELKIRLRTVISNLYNDFKGLRNSLDERDMIRFKKLWYGETDADYIDSLNFLARILKEYYNQKVVILIDEYDAPLITAYEYGYYNEARNFFSALYSSVLKDNVNLQTGVMTGIIRVAKAGIFSDLNNLKVNTILSENYDDSFGLLESEVEAALNYYGMEYNITEVKNWYDGYRFGNVEVYNPWSILNYLEYKELGAYWIDTSGNYLIKDILKLADEEIFSKLNTLLTGEKIKEEITGKSSLKDILDIHDVWELLLFSGYLTINEKIDRKTYTLRIPNEEVKEFFRDSFIEIAFGGGSTFKRLIKSLLNNRIEEFEGNLQDILIKYMSFNDTSTIEKVYHNFILGLMIYLDADYKVTSNLESGFGRYDILIEPLDKKGRAFVLEFKTADSEKKLEARAEEGLRQIEKKKYYLTLKESGLTQITLLGMAFHKKLVKIKAKEI